MTRVFLSHATEDEAVAKRLTQWFEDSDIDFLWWQRSARGGRFVSDIEKGISTADLFVVLLSPHYLTSAWCRHERDLALHREIDLHSQFLYVLAVADVPLPASGTLRSYDWLDATQPLDNSKLEAIAGALRLDRVPANARPPAASPVMPVPVFRNRHDELAELLNALTTTGGRNLWVVFSPPRMGKSWLLDRMQQELAIKDPRWSVRLLDLREQPADLRINSARLVKTLLAVDFSDMPGEGPLSDDNLREIAATLSRRGHPQLYVLDSADLLSSVCAIHVRSALTAIYRLVVRSGSRETRLSFVIGTRRYDEWRGLGLDPRGGLRFTPLTLTAFSVDVVHQALGELDIDFGSEFRWYWAQKLHRLGEGLPALLAPSLQWAERRAFLTIDESDGETAFDEVARPHIKNYLISPPALLPQGSKYPRQAMDVLERALRILTAYRLFTQSHLRHHTGEDSSLQAALAEAGWSPGELWDALGATSLCDQPVELWQVIEPSIRRLLYRYYYRTDADRAAAHVAARDFYLGWTAARTGGREQQVVLVECLWHEASLMVIEQPDDVARLLPQVAANLALEFANSPIFEPLELSSFVVGLLGNDEEFQMLLQSYDGVFDEIIKSVVQTIGGTP